ncbi:MAG: hypothetical protein ACR2M2_03695, partial [Gaiellaceae bacterium]
HHWLSSKVPRDDRFRDTVTPFLHFVDSAAEIQGRVVVVAPNILPLLGSFNPQVSARFRAT